MRYPGSADKAQPRRKSSLRPADSNPRAVRGWNRVTIGILSAVCLLLAQGQLAAADTCWVLGDTGFVLDLKEGVEVTVSDSGVNINYAPGGRSAKWIALISAETESKDTVDTLKNGLIIHYATEVQEDSGSGGAEAYLYGWIEMDSPVSVRCAWQNEMPYAAWCLSELGRMRLAAEGCLEGK